MYFMLKSYPNISLRDLDPENIIRHEDLVGLQQLQIWFNDKADKDAKLSERRARTKANNNKKSNF